MKTKPSSIKAGYFTYDIEFNTRSITDAHGETDTDNKTITIHDRRSEELNRETLFHEILHVAFADSFVFEGDKADDLEERAIRIISPRLIQIFRDNPDLSRYLFYDTEEDYDYQE